MADRQSASEVSQSGAGLTPARDCRQSCYSRSSWIPNVDFSVASILDGDMDTVLRALAQERGFSNGSRFGRCVAAGMALTGRSKHWPYDGTQAGSESARCSFRPLSTRRALYCATSCTFPAKGNGSHGGTPINSSTFPDYASTRIEARSVARRSETALTPEQVRLSRPVCSIAKSCYLQAERQPR